MDNCGNSRANTCAKTLKLLKRQLWGLASGEKSPPRTIGTCLGRTVAFPNSYDPFSIRPSPWPSSNVYGVKFLNIRDAAEIQPVQDLGGKNPALAGKSAVLRGLTVRVRDRRYIIVTMCVCVCYHEYYHYDYY